MSETTIRIDDVLSELTIYMVKTFGMTPRDAVGLVMQSEVAEKLREKDTPLLDCPISQLALQLV